MEENRQANKVNGKMLNGLHLYGAFLAASQQPKALYKGKALPLQGQTEAGEIVGASSVGAAR